MALHTHCTLNREMNPSYSATSLSIGFFIRSIKNAAAQAAISVPIGPQS